VNVNSANLPGTTISLASLSTGTESPCQMHGKLRFVWKLLVERVPTGTASTVFPEFRPEAGVWSSELRSSACFRRQRASPVETTRESVWNFRY
jgi:hypothetical protein